MLYSHPSSSKNRICLLLTCESIEFSKFSTFSTRSKKKIHLKLVNHLSSLNATGNIVQICIPKLFRNRLFFLVLARQLILARSSVISAPVLRAVISPLGRQQWICDPLSFANYVRSFLIRHRIILSPPPRFHLEIRVFRRAVCLVCSIKRAEKYSNKKRVSCTFIQIFFYTMRSARYYWAK